MQATSVTSKGPSRSEREARQRLGIRRGSRIEFVLRGDGRVELRVERASAPAARNGFGLLKSLRKPVVVDLDPAS